MRLSIAASVLACALAHAFSDSTPFILLNSRLEGSAAAPGPQLQTTSQVLSSAQALLANCPTERYLLISQPNLHASDLRCPSDRIPCRKTLHLAEVARTSAAMSVSEVVGRSFAFDDFSAYISEACRARGVEARISDQTLKELPPVADGRAARDAVLSQNDAELEQIFKEAWSEGHFVAIYFSNPSEPSPYEAEFDEPVRMDLRKRQQSAGEAEPLLHMRAASNSTNSHLGVFHRYTFFTPGVFMGFFAMFIMLSILYVGLSALTGLQVSYGAFEKEMGPAAQKKQH